MKDENQFTKKETEVLMLVATGLSRKEIAKKLNISVRTVDSHLVLIYMKTGVDDYPKLVVYAVEWKRNLLASFIIPFILAKVCLSDVLNDYDFLIFST